MKVSIIKRTTLAALLFSTIQFAHAGGLDLFKAATNDLREMSEISHAMPRTTRTFTKSPYYEIWLEQPITSHQIRYARSFAAQRELHLNFVKMSPQDGEYFLIMEAGIGGEGVYDARLEIARVNEIVQKALLKSKAVRANQKFGASVIEGLKGQDEQQIAVLVKSPEHLQRIIRDIDQAIKEANIGMSAAGYKFPEFVTE
jgi:hypothetical protein